MMERGLFRKFFVAFFCIFLICITFLGLLILTFADRYMTVNEQKQLKMEAETLQSVVTSAYQKAEYQYVPRDEIKAEFEVLSGMTENQFLLVDVNGKILCTTDETLSGNLSTELTQKVRKGQKLFTTTNLQDLLPSPATVAAQACQNEKGEIYAYLFVYRTTATNQNFLSGLRRFFSLNAVIVVAVAFLIASKITEHIARPLREMSKAAESFAKGDFSARIVVQDADDEISQLAINFNEMASALDQLERTRSGFVANVSHDLRTPMTTIGGFIDGILDGTIPEEKSRYYLKIVSDEVKRLSRLVGVMMNVSKIEAGEVHLSLADVNLFENTCSMLFSFEQRIEAKHLEILLPESADIMVSGDSDLLNQVIYNLIDNAVKFTPEGGKISFAFEKDAESHMGVLSVENSGEGISPEAISHIFERFYKTDRSRGLDKNGMGLGLYIAKSIIDAHRGSISVTSKPGNGTTFRVALPLPKEGKKNVLFHGRNDHERAGK